MAGLAGGIALTGEKLVGVTGPVKVERPRTYDLDLSARTASRSPECTVRASDSDQRPEADPEPLTL
jgi:hypothetical protein